MSGKGFITGMLLVLASAFAQASIDVYEFDDPAKEERFRTLAAELRCPKCQNQNVNDSDAPLAKDIKDRVVMLLDEGKSNEEIVDYMVERYGEFVTYRPRMSPGVMMLWLAPAVLGGMAVLGLFLFVSRRRSVAPPPPVDLQRVNALLEKHTGDIDVAGDTPRRPGQM